MIIIDKYGLKKEYFMELEEIFIFLSKTSFLEHKTINKGGINNG